MATSKWRYFFWVAAIYNFVAGLPPILAPVQTALAAGLPVPDPAYILTLQTVGALVTTYGIGYIMVALGKPGARQIVLMGAIGKLTLCVLLALRMQEGPVPQQILYATAGDFIFTVFFIIFLLKGPIKT